MVSLDKNEQASWVRRKEALITTLVGGIPQTAGIKLRNLLYRHILARLGSSVIIQFNVELQGAYNIEIGDTSRIYRDVGLICVGENSRICISDRVILDRGIEIRTDQDGCTIEIGDRTYIGCYSIISGPGNIKIGKDCLIASHCGIFANNHIFSDPTIKIRKQGITKKGIVIEDDCWLGTGVKVLDGVTIGEGSVVGAGSVVTKHIPPYSVAAGVPAKVISKRTEKVLHMANCS